jgi:hypothetical protein
MTATERSICIKRLALREGLGDRIALIGEAYHVFRRGFDEGVFTFGERRAVCRFLSTLMKPLDRDTRDLCLLASHAENGELFQSICPLSRQRMQTNDDTKERLNDYVVSRGNDLNDSTTGRG